MKKEKTILLVILFLAIILRFSGLGTRPLDGDEGVMIQTADTNSLRETIELSRIDAHPPLSFITNYVSWHYLGESEFASRFFSALAGVLLVLVTYKFIELAFSQKIALVTSLLVAVSPHLIAFSQENRMYSILALFAICSLYYFVLAIKNLTIGYLTLLIIFDILTLYTHLVGWVIIVAQGLFYLYRLKENRKIFVPFFISFGIILLLYLPILNPTIAQINGRKLDQPIGMSAKESIIGLGKAVYQFGGGAWLADSPYKKYIYVLSLLIPLVIVGYGINKPGQKNTQPNNARQMIWLVVAISVIASFASREIGARAERTLIFLSPIYLIYVSTGLIELWDRGKVKTKKISRGVVVARLLISAQLIIFLFGLYNHYFIFNRRVGENTIAQFLGNRLLPGDAVYIKGSFFSGDAFAYEYYRNRFNSPAVPVYSYYGDYKIGNLAQIRTKSVDNEIQSIFNNTNINRIWFYDFSYTESNKNGTPYQLGLDKENQEIIVWEITKT